MTQALLIERNETALTGDTTRKALLVNMVDRTGTSVSWDAMSPSLSDGLTSVITTGG